MDRAAITNKNLSTGLNISHPNKILWPDEGYTKGNVIEYYQSIAKYILPYLKGRPQSLYRTPNGLRYKGFYQKNAGNNFPKWIDMIPLFSKWANRKINYIVCNNSTTLAYLNNIGCIEINPWHSTIDQLDRPDYMVIDIDPSPSNSFEQVIETAQAVHEVLKKAGTDGYCKTSGSTGIHVYIPLKKRYTYDEMKDFAKLLCIRTHELLPGFTSLERNLKKRGANIYLDHQQNRKGQTISAVYSLRPRPGATVSTPLKWTEVKSGISPLDFTIKTLPTRLNKMGDLFTGILGKGIDIAACLKRLNKK